MPPGSGREIPQDSGGWAETSASTGEAWPRSWLAWRARLLKREGTCQLPRGWGTDHPGSGHCRKARENRLRRAAGRQGYRLAKNPRRDPLGIGFGSYQIIDSRTGEVVASFGWDDRPGAVDRLAEAEAWLLRKDR